MVILIHGARVMLLLLLLLPDGHVPSTVQILSNLRVHGILGRCLIRGGGELQHHPDGPSAQDDSPDEGAEEATGIEYSK
jgi:hypothetical protein